MKLNRLTKYFFVVVHLFVAIIMLWHAINVNLENYGLLALMACLVIFAYCLTTVTKIVRTGIIDRYTFVLSVGISVVVVAFIGWYGIGLILDLLRMRCDFIFSENVTCTVYPVVFGIGLVLHPFTLITVAFLTLPSFATSLPNLRHK